ncbi:MULTISPECIES: fused response regulator/phosphatase [Streptomyces]|uniref:fused response regulator/phosphatase n=1 Tax=Streptomyces TaxID=1883 RepID=UPI0013CBB90C|nr:MULTISPECIES: fused response regulator/phosphatase [Streptomyces]MBY8867850.1 fused response regulator/phosphatase [Streptomyces sennicomposti]NED38267.1 fused response regulator/phosphatase [Streptomyces sp. SID8499]NED73734.1 fused response regulator/phosphatase [Streptomyces sp. SID9944]
MTRPSDTDHSPAHILVVDDTPANRYVLATTLRRAGHQVTEAEDGTRALDLLRGPGPLPEIAIVDVRLPDMTGFEVCEHIKNDPATAAVPVINISAAAITVDDRAQGLYRGADAYLVEPVAPDELLATVTATLRYTRARRRAELLAERLHLLNRLTLALYSAADARELVKVTAEAAAVIFRCSVAALLTTPQGSPLVAHTWQDEDGTARADAPQVHSTAAWPQRRDPSGRAQPPGTDLPCLPPELKDPARRRTVIGRAKAERPPVVIVTSADAVTTPDDEQLLTQLTQASALALEALRSYSEEHALALTLQRSFLPESLPATPRADLAVRYLPASERTEIGGDFYEAISTPAGLVVAVGDVAGHSLDAAMVMGQVRHALRAYAAEGHPPQVILSCLDHLLASVEPGATVTLCVVLIEFGSDTLHVANAGHLPPLIRHPDGTTSYVHEHGPLLGLGLAHPPARRITVVPGSLLLLVTDGLVERRHEDLQHSLATLAAVAAGVPADPEEACGLLLERLLPDGSDDVALMAVRLNAVRPD